MVNVLAKGYGITLGTINALSVLISVFEAIPSLGLQVNSALMIYRTLAHV